MKRYTAIAEQTPWHATPIPSPSRIVTALNDGTTTGRLIDNRCAISRSAGWGQVRRRRHRPTPPPIYTDTGHRLTKHPPPRRSKPRRLPVTPPLRCAIAQHSASLRSATELRRSAVLRRGGWMEQDEDGAVETCATKTSTASARPPPSPQLDKMASIDSGADPETQLGRVERADQSRRCRWGLRPAPICLHQCQRRPQLTGWDGRRLWLRWGLLCWEGLNRMRGGGIRRLRASK